ncbi:MAG: hypothetical protein JO250_03725 [Armatimonadetes bacterium]|nr:hypothetical protein [Armatimonadota bacterium]
MRRCRLPLTPRRRAWIAREVCETLFEPNRGRCPRSLAEWERVARRLGVRIHVTRDAAEPSLRYNHFLMRGVLYLPPTDDWGRTHTWLLHEMAELCLSWPGRAPVVYPPHWGGHHALAVVVEEEAAVHPPR